MKISDVLIAVLFGIVEGITEWLPISSSGHLIILNELISLNSSEEFFEFFLVAIQLGAMLAVPLAMRNSFSSLFFKKGERDNRFSNIMRIAIGIMPAAILGFLLDDIIEEKLFNYAVVALSLFIYGVVFLFVGGRREREYRIVSLDEIKTRDALLIGLFQALSLIPGTSRSGATILGGVLMGCSRAAASEFSFFMAIPTMAGASLIKVLKFGLNFTGAELLILLVGCVTAFVVSVVAIKTFIGYIKRHSFTAFGWYRIALGALVALYFLIK